MGSTMKLADCMRQSIRCRSGHVVLRAELAPLGSASQVSQALKTLQRDGELLRLGAGVYAKARRDESTHEVTPVVEAETLGREVAHKLKAKVIDGGDGTLVLDTGDRRVSRKLALGRGAVQLWIVERRRLGRTTSCVSRCMRTRSPTVILLEACLASPSALTLTSRRSPQDTAWALVSKTFDSEKIRAPPRLMQTCARNLSPRGVTDAMV